MRIYGTPVPAVIATDMRALKRMAEKKTGLPCITAECTGTNYYANMYPELTTATVHGPVIENDTAVYEFKTTIGTKG